MRVNWLRRCSSSARTTSLSCSSIKRRSTRPSALRYRRMQLGQCFKCPHFWDMDFRYIFGQCLFALNSFCCAATECPAGCVGEKCCRVSHQRRTGIHQAQGGDTQLPAPAVPERCKFSLQLLDVPVGTSVLGLLHPVPSCCLNGRTMEEGKKFSHI